MKGPKPLMTSQLTKDMKQVTTTRGKSISRPAPNRGKIERVDSASAPRDPLQDDQA